MVMKSMGSDPTGSRLQRIQSSPQYDGVTEKFLNQKPPTASANPDSGAMWEFFFNDNETRPKQLLPEVSANYTQLAKSDNAHLVWFGHSTLLLEIDGLRILIDPVFSDYASPIPFAIKRFQASVIDIDAIPEIDVVVFSHDHYDHLDYQTVAKLKNRDIKFLMPLGVGAHLERWGVATDKIIELDWWDEIDIEGVMLTCSPSQHFSGRGLNNRNTTLWSSWAIKGKAQNIYFSGDTGYGPHFKEIGQRLGPFDISFLENGAYNLKWRYVHQLPEEGVQAHEDLRSSVMVPIHWGMFDLSIHDWYEPIMRVTTAARDKGIDIVTPRLGQVVEIGATFEKDDWWLKFLTSAD